MASARFRVAAIGRAARKVRQRQGERAWQQGFARAHRPEEGAGLGWERFDYGSHLHSDCVFDSREVVTEGNAKEYA